MIFQFAFPLSWIFLNYHEHFAFLSEYCNLQLSQCKKFLRSYRHNFYSTSTSCRMHREIFSFYSSRFFYIYSNLRQDVKEMSFKKAWILIPWRLCSCLNIVISNLTFLCKKNLIYRLIYRNGSFTSSLPPKNAHIFIVLMFEAWKI